MSVDSKIEGAIEGAPDNGYHRDILRFRPWGRQASHDTKPVRDYDIVEWGTGTLAEQQAASDGAK